jgi:hypothetical protein
MAMTNRRFKQIANRSLLTRDSDRWLRQNAQSGPDQERNRHESVFRADGPRWRACQFSSLAAASPNGIRPKRRRLNRSGETYSPSEGYRDNCRLVPFGAKGRDEGRFARSTIELRDLTRHAKNIRHFS